MEIKDVIGYGALNMDELMLVDKIPKADEEGYVRSVECHPGGSAANTIVGLARLGLNTGYIGNIGDDDIGKILLEDPKFKKIEKKDNPIIIQMTDDGMTPTEIGDSMGFSSQAVGRRLYDLKRKK